MLIDSKNEHLLLDDSFKCNNYKDVQYYVRGFVYIEGFHSGPESINVFIKKFLDNGVFCFDLLKGSFSIILMYDDVIVIFTDNSNQNCLFYNKSIVSSRMDLLLKHNQENKCELSWNDEALCEYLTLGRIYSNDTLINDVKVLDAREYIFWKEEIEVKKKGIAEIYDSNKSFNAKEFFRNLAYALEDVNNVEALTGGYDSRLVTVQLSKWMYVHPFIFSNSKSDIQQIIAEKVSAVLGAQLDVLTIPKPTIDDGLIIQLIETDDMTPLNVAGNYYQLYMKGYLNKKDVKLFITGDGGVLHKDWEWMQDLPFYNKKKVNLSRFYEQRIEFIKCNEQLGIRLNHIYKDQKHKILTKLQECVRETNTTSYDCLYYYYTGNRRLYYSLIEHGVNMYAPLNELDFIRYSYQLPRRQRFFYNSMRRMMTSANFQAARIPTNYGTTASSETLFLLRDVLFQGIDYSKKLIRMVGRKLVNKSLFVSSPIDWNGEDVRKTSLAKKSIDYARELQILNEQIDVNSIELGLLSRLIHIFYWDQKYNIALHDI